MTTNHRLWIGRLLIGLVFVMNVQSALAFLGDPTRYAPAYELADITGEAAIRGFAVLFLMWNVPYTVALIDPAKYRISLYEAIAMQSIGLVGETLILTTIPLTHAILRSSILRFIIFDGTGLVALLLAAWVTRTKTWKVSETSQV